MSFTTDEIKTLKELAKPKKFFDYAYKNHGAHIERELTPDEFKDWCNRIDAVSPALDPLCIKFGKDEIHWGEGQIVTAAAAGEYAAGFDNLWAATPTKLILSASINAGVHYNYAMCRTFRRIGGGTAGFTYGQLSDGAFVGVYQISAVANTVNIGVMAIIERG